jgi:hypothetical protein
MSAMTPVRYAEKYLHLEVPFDDGPVYVGITRYLLRDPTAEQQGMWGAFKDYMRKNGRVRVRVNGENAEFTSAESALHRVVNPFYGKGSPEDCQIVLQLAVLLRRVNSKHELQGYADANLGLDCNGFVGNYLFRIVGGNGWRVDPPDDGVGPSRTIRQIMDKAGGFVIHTVDQMVPSRMHVLAELDDHDRIIPGGPNSATGHIAITEPGRYMPSYMTMDLGAANKGVLGAPAFWATESAGHIGLIQSWYAVTQLVRQNKPVDAVFRVYRASRRAFLNFRIIGL